MIPDHIIQACLRVDHSDQRQTHRYGDGWPTHKARARNKTWRHKRRDSETK